MLQELEDAVDPGRLRRCVEEIAHLSRGDLGAEQFFKKFMMSFVAAAGARGMAMWFPHGQEFQCAGATGMEETEYASDPRQKEAIQGGLRECAEKRHPLIIGAGNAEGVQRNGRLPNFRPFPFLYIPITSGEAAGEIILLGVLQAWFPAGFDPRRFNEIVPFAQSMAREAGVFLRARRIETMAAGQTRLQKMVLFVTELSGQYDMKRLGTVLVNWAREITGCDRCAFFAADAEGRLSVVAVSNVEVVNPKSALVQLQLKLAQEAMDAMQPTLFQKSAPKEGMRGDMSDYFVLSHAADALAVPMLDGGKQKLGVLLAESHRDRALDKETQNAVITVANRAIKPLAATVEIEQLPMLRVMRKAANLRRRMTETGPKKLFYKYGIPSLAAACMALFPLRLVVRSDCMLIPKVRGVAVVQVQGRVKQVFVHEGEVVAAGQPIAQIDDEDIQQNLRLSQEEQQRYLIEANRAEAAGDEAGRQIGLIEANSAGRQVDLMKLELERTCVRAPIAGVVLTKEIETLAGSMVPAGTRLCEIGDFRHWELISKVAESEIGLLETRLRQGPLKMEFVLNSAPGRQIDAIIPNEQSISPVSTAIPGANVFLVRAQFAETPDLVSGLKSGYSGRSKIPLDRRPALYLALRKFINYLRVRWFF